MAGKKRKSEFERAGEHLAEAAPTGSKRLELMKSINPYYEEDKLKEMKEKRNKKNK